MRIMTRQKNDIGCVGRVSLKKRILSLALVISFCLSMTMTASAATKTISSDTEINQILAAIDKQNFSDSGTTAAATKAKISHFIYNSDWRPNGGKKFPYRNDKYSYIGTMNDGTYSFALNWTCAGCYAYAEYVYGVIHGSTKATKLQSQKHTVSTLQSLLQTYGRAGAHLRIDGRHSLTFISATDTGFYALEYGGDSNQKIYLSYWTYKDFINKYGSSNIWLWNKTNAVNTGYKIKVPAVRPGAPTNLSAVRAGDNTATLSWTEGPWATSYEVEYYSRSAGAYTKDPDYKSGTSYISTGLSLYDSYDYRVRSVNDYGTSVWVEVTYINSIPVVCSNHDYNSSGYCKNCGAEYYISLTEMSARYYAVKDDVPLRARPYAPDTILRYLRKNETVSVVGRGYNSVGNLWYKLSDGNWVFSDNVAPAEPSIDSRNKNMIVDVGAGNTLRFCSYVSTADSYHIGSISNGATIYVYGYTTQQYEDRTWAKINYNGQTGWVNTAWLKDVQSKSQQHVDNSYKLDGYDCNKVERNMTVDVGAGSTLRFCDSPTQNNTKLGAISNGATVYVYGTTVNQYPNVSGTYITWAKISYNGQAGWVRYSYLR